MSEILKTLPADALDVSNFIIAYENNNNRNINLQKLSHLLYIAQGYSLNINHQPAFYDNILTTKNITVVIPSVINAFIKYGNDNIKSLYRTGSEYSTYMMLLEEAKKDIPGLFKDTNNIKIYPFPEEQKKVFARICDVYKNWNGSQLHDENINRESSAIKRIRSQNDLTVAQIVPLSDIGNEFKLLINKNVKKQQEEKNKILENKVIDIKPFLS